MLLFLSSRARNQDQFEQFVATGTSFDFLARYTTISALTAMPVTPCKSENDRLLLQFPENPTLEKSEGEVGNADSRQQPCITSTLWRWWITVLTEDSWTPLLRGPRLWKPFGNIILSYLTGYVIYLPLSCYWYLNVNHLFCENKDSGIRLKSRIRG